jgi:hypothetical protein
MNNSKKITSTLKHNPDCVVEVLAYRNGQVLVRDKDNHEFKLHASQLLAWLPIYELEKLPTFA